jgi:hypothetical protein
MLELYCFVQKCWKTVANIDVRGSDRGMLELDFSAFVMIGTQS